MLVDPGRWCQEEVSARLRCRETDVGGMEKSVGEPPASLNGPPREGLLGGTGSSLSVPTG